MNGKNESLEMRDRIFSEEQMYYFVGRAAKEKKFFQTERALPLMKQYHSGQFREGKERVPYINHPLMMACHAFALHIENDDMIAAILYHDVCEDCGVELEELPANENVREIVDCLTFRVEDGETRAEAKQRYYEKIRRNKLAAIIKLLDRCNNVSTMANGFTKERMKKYIRETENYILPLIDFVEENCQEWLYAAFLLRYQIQSMIESLKRVL